MTRLLLAALLVLLLAAAPAQASRGQESTFQDDNHLIHAPAHEVRATLDELKALGVDRLRVTLLWKVVAPQSGSRNRPAFDAADPNAYPPGSWDRYDVLVREATARGLGVNFNVSGPAPLWATQPAPREDIVETYEPSPSEFAQFVAAAGRRYSGETAGLPRVDYWSIWNEPNQSGWLTPQWSQDGGGFERAASLYRELADAAWAALHATGHGSDTILVGETAPKGDRSKGIKRQVEMMTFFRALYCVDGRYRRLRGARAAQLGCPAKASDFRAQHPVLFEASGFAHHPYELILPPVFPPPRANWVTIANLSRLTRALDRTFRAYGSKRRMPLYLTEYGYQTNPPDAMGVKWSRQAAYLNQSEYIAWRNPRVKTLAQFLLFDDDMNVPASFQSGLRTIDGKAKPSYNAYRLPVWLPRSSTRRGRSITLWALLRMAPNGVPAKATIEFRRSGTKRYRRVKRVTTRDKRNYLRTRVRVTRSGHFRVRYGGVRSRPAFVRVR